MKYYSLEDQGPSFTWSIEVDPTLVILDVVVGGAYTVLLWDVHVALLLALQFLRKRDKSPHSPSVPPYSTDLLPVFLEVLVCP